MESTWTFLSNDGTIAIAAAITMAAAVLGGTRAQGQAASTALEGIARNPSAQPKMFVPMLLSLALMESLVILTWLVANNIVGKIN